MKTTALGENIANTLDGIMDVAYMWMQSGGDEDAFLATESIIKDRLIDYGCEFIFSNTIPELDCTDTIYIAFSVKASEEDYYTIIALPEVDEIRIKRYNKEDFFQKVVW